MKGRVISKDNAEHYSWGDKCDGWHLVKSPGLSVIQERVPSSGGEARHYHRQAQQFFYVLKGVATLEVDGDISRLTSGQGQHVAIGVPHRLTNEGAHDLELLVVSVPMAHGDRVIVE